ncbi:MAG: hypothetical protein ABIG44_13510 [Planctomycetota bacterium]
MLKSLGVLLNEVMDYTGLFPPDELPLAEALANYSRYRGESESWMLARLLCPVTVLDQLGNFRDQCGGPQDHCRLAVRGAEHPLSPEFIKDVRAIDHFAKSHQARAAIKALELRLPAETINSWSADEIGEGLNVLAGKLLEHNFSDVEVFIEPIEIDDWDMTVARVVTALQRHDQEHGAPAPARIGFKLRTGGVEKSAYPSVAHVALAIATCRDASIPLKFTSGLLNPIRAFDEQLQVETHGFLNVFIAGVLAHARGIDASDLQAVLDERNVQAFEFTDHGFRWHNLEATVEEIETARRELLISFGGHCFDRVRTGLQSIGLQ